MLGLVDIIAQVDNYKHIFANAAKENNNGRTLLVVLGTEK
jgi:hypothetical protein